MLRLSALFITSFLFFLQGSALAYIGLCCAKCGGNMPLNILGAGVPETHEFRFKLSPVYMKMDGLLDGTKNVGSSDLLGMPAMGKFMAVPENMEMTMVNFAVGYSFTDDFFGGLMFMWKKNSMDMVFNSMMKANTGKNGFKMESEGMGDTMFMTKYRLYTDDPLIPKSQISFLSGFTLPTGSNDAKNGNHPLTARKGEKLPYSMQLGSGTFDPILGVLYQGSTSPWWWGANLIYTGRWYTNGQGYTLGDELKTDLYVMHQVRHNLVAQLQLNWKYWGKTKGEMDEVKSGVSGRATKGVPTSPLTTPLYDKNNYGGTKLSVTAGFQWQPLPFQILELDFGLPLLQNLNGPQLKEEYRVSFTWYLELPTSASRRAKGNKASPPKSKLGF
ncbi:MAG: transporter [Nitrospinota bacterium]